MKLHFAKDSKWKKIFLWSSDNAFYSKRDCETVSVDWEKKDVKNLIKWKKFTIDEKKKTVLIK